MTLLAKKDSAKVKKIKIIKNLFHFLVNLRLKVARAQCVQSLAAKLDGTVCIDGSNKTQLRFPNNLKFLVGAEVTLKQGKVEWNGKFFFIFLYF